MTDITPQRQPLTVQKFEQIGKTKYRLKIAETKINLTNVTIQNVQYKVTKRMTRGRYVVEPL